MTKESAKSSGLVSKRDSVEDVKQWTRGFCKEMLRREVGNGMDEGNDVTKERVRNH